ncbi:MAG TPA: hypothetical protein VJH03_17645 [Blastocatellia bacterium]|nr:hypothetical protein [Blastocatellia bacterium]
MSEQIQLREPLFKLIVRFSNGESVHYVAADPIDARALSADIRYAVISSYSCQNPSECTDTALVNLRDVTFIKTERVTLDQLAAERRMAGMRASSQSDADERLPKTIATIRFC